MTQPLDPPATDPSDDLDELVSAYLDGEATPEESARVDADPELQARVAGLRAVAAAVAGPFAPPSAEARESAITAALAAAVAAGPTAPVPGGPVDLDAERTRRAGQRRRLWAVSVAAALLVGLAAVPLLASLGSDEGNDDTATAAAEADRAEPSASTADEDLAGAGAEDDGDDGTFTESAEDDGPPAVALGTFATEDDLVQAVRRVQTGAESAGPAASSTLPAVDAAVPPCPSPLAASDEIIGRYQAVLENAPVTVYVYRTDTSGPTMIVLDATCDLLSQTDL